MFGVIQVGSDLLMARIAFVMTRFGWFQVLRATIVGPKSGLALTISGSGWFSIRRFVFNVASWFLISEYADIWVLAGLHLCAIEVIAVVGWPKRMGLHVNVD